jgi:nicotinate-nucleotide adenylyltransferase
MAYTADGKKIRKWMKLWDRPWMSNRKVTCRGVRGNDILVGGGCAVSASSMYSSEEALVEAKRVLIFGGTFDPIHNGHLIACRTVAEGLGIKRIILIPSGRHPYKHDITSPEMRMKMVEDAIEGEPLFEVCDCEFNREGFSYSADTAEWIKEDLCRKMEEVYWMIGEDNVSQIPKWYKAEKFVKEVRFAVACRQTDDNRGSKETLTAVEAVEWRKIHDEMEIDFIDTPIIEISSSMVRERVKQGKSIKYLVPEKVEEDIYVMNLYK